MPTKPRDKGPWKGPSHHRNQSKAKPVQVQKKPAYFTKQKAGTFRREQPFDYYMVIDFECTCEMEDNSWPHEIIEFPVVLMKADTGDFVAEFHRYVRPLLRPILTPFCKNLTGIQQETVDKADPLAVVVKDFQRWLDLTLPPGASVCCATDGPTDMEKFMYRYAVRRDGVPFPELLFTYVDVKLTFSKFFRTKSKLRLPIMLRELGMKMEGQLHSGIDDTRNIARLMNAMMDKGCVFQHPLFIRHGADAADTEALFDHKPENDDGDEDGDAGSQSGDDVSREGDGEEHEDDNGDDEPSDDACAAEDEAAEGDCTATASGSGGEVTAPSKTRPRVILHKRDLDTEARTSANILRRQKISGALASEEDMRSLRQLAGSKSVTAGGSRWQLIIFVAIVVASLANLYAVYSWA